MVEARRVGATACVVVLLLLSACSHSKKSPATTSAAPSSPIPSAAAVPVPATAGAPDAPPEIKAAGGDTNLNVSSLPQGVAAEYGPICRAAALGIEKIDFAKATIGWAQSDAETTAASIAATKSQVDEAKKRKIHLITTNAASNVQQENTDIKGMIDKGAKAIIFSPVNSTGLGDAIAYARSKHVAMVAVDRTVNTAVGCSEIGPQLGSDFVHQGQLAADAMIEATGGVANLAILLGTAGDSVTADRTNGFLAELKAKNADGIKVIFQQSGDFTREKGQSVTEALLQSHPEVNAIYAENDEMGLGALIALSEKDEAGTSKVHIVSIEGTKAALQAVVDGNFDAVIGSNAAYGPAAEDALNAYVDGDGAAAVTVMTDTQYDKSNAQAALSDGAAF